MAEGQGKQRWAHTALICALIANAHRDPKRGRPFSPEDFNPYAEGQGAVESIEINPQTIGLMRQAFTGT